MSDSGRLTFSLRPGFSWWPYILVASLSSNFSIEQRPRDDFPGKKWNLRR